MDGKTRHFIKYCRDGEIYFWSFHDDQLQTLLRTFGMFAADEQIDFDWHDAAECSQIARDAVYGVSREEQVQEPEFVLHWSVLVISGAFWGGVAWLVM